MNLIAWGLKNIHKNINARVLNTSSCKTMTLSKCATCDSKKSYLLKGLLSNLGLRASLSKVLLLGNVLFWTQFHWSKKWMK